MALALFAAALVLLPREGASIRSYTETTGSGCNVVEGAVKRKGFHWLQKCKCAADDAVLTEACGVESGERKFDVTRIELKTQAKGKSQRKEIADGCKCAPAQEGPETNPEESPKVETESTDQQEKICARWGAFPREGLFHKRGCKCQEDWTLSAECGDRRLLRKFDPKDDDVQNGDCRCMKEEEQSRNKELLGPTEPTPTEVGMPTQDGQQQETTETTPITCSNPPPEGFEFGDLVRIEKKVHVGYKWEIGGIGVGAKYKDARKSGTIAQVICTESSKAAQGRVCLRKGAEGAKSAGCWDRSNLVKLDS